MDLFYQESLSVDSQEWKISREESRHIEKVLRKKIGDQIQFTNGKGLIHTVEIEFIASAGIQVRSLSHKQHPAPSEHLHIAIAPTKNTNRLEWFLEKATELGIGEITLLLCERSERKIIKPDRLEKILIRALKQSQRLHLPLLRPMTGFQEFIQQQKHPAYLAHCDLGPKKGIWELTPKDLPLTILIGPEGDFSPAEIAYASLHKHQMLDLGSLRLRTETAGILAVSAFHRLAEQIQ